jgi:hypothetical protein
MHAKRLCLEFWTAVALPLLPALGCDAVRTGNFSGEIPGAIRVNIPQTAELVAQVNQGTAEPYFASSLQRLRATRQWASFDSSSSAADAVSEAGLPSHVDLPVWQRLAHALDWTTPNHEDFWARRFNGAGLLADDHYIYSAYDATAVVTTASLFLGPRYGGGGLVDVDVDNLLLVADREMDIQPVGPAGPTLRVAGGFHRFRRSCTPEGQQTFTEVALNAPIDLVQIGTADSLDAAMDAGEYLGATCGMAQGFLVDLGTVAAPIPGHPTSASNAHGPPLGVRALVWSPSSDGLFLVAQQEALRGASYAQIDHLTLGDSATTLITSGDITPPMTIATSGTSLLYWVVQERTAVYIRQSLSGAVLPLQAPLPDQNNYRSDPPNTALSPDGNILAMPSMSTEGASFVDLRTMRSSNATMPLPYSGWPRYRARPRAWAPTGDAVLMEMDSEDYGGENLFLVLPLIFTDGLPTSVGPISQLAFPAFLQTNQALDNTQYRSASLRYFWSATGPQVLFQDALGTRSYNFVTQQSALLVAPDQVAPPTAAIDVCVATDQVFAWATRCFGIGEIHCQDQMRRLSLATGAIDVVATADQPWMFAVSPDGKQIAFADHANIYIKALVP